MKDFAPDFRFFAGDRPCILCPAQVFWLSFWLTFGFYSCSPSAQATVLATEPDFAEWAIAASPTDTLSAANPVASPAAAPHEPADPEPTATAPEPIEAPAAVATNAVAPPLSDQSPSLATDSPPETAAASLIGLKRGAIAQATPPIPAAEAENAAPQTAQIELNPATSADEFLPAETDAAAPDLPPQAEPLQTYQPLLAFQAVAIVQDDEFAGRLRTTAVYAVSEQVLFGATVDLTTGEAFVDSRQEGLSLNELYVAAAPIRELPNLRLVAGLLDLTSYFDRNSFAKDGATHFFSPAFQTNPALSAAGIATRPGLLVNWSATDQLELKAAAFASTRDLGDFALDGFAAEVGFRVENLIVRGTYATARDAGENDGFGEIFQFQRNNGRFGLLATDREVAYGFNAEYFIEPLNLGLFGRYGWYENTDLNRGGSTFSLGLNALDVFSDQDRLGLAYGQQLTNDDLRSGKRPDVWELFYDAPIVTGVRAGISLQSREEWSETVVGFRLRADW
ncbi:porin [Almyronema epifaneia]|uniref:Porin n=1 Tax=Almyronema epifaneia S1 TaxID=2991925 RepID=A0ABW6IB70_9CYAN